MSVGMRGSSGVPVARAQGPDGYDTYCIAPSCTGVPTPCHTTVQVAVDATGELDDVVKVAVGVYTGVNTYGGLRQVMYVSKTVTIRDGYTVTNWSTPYPITQPTRSPRPITSGNCNAGHANCATDRPSDRLRADECETERCLNTYS